MGTTVRAVCATCADNSDHQPTELAREWAQQHVRDNARHGVLLVTTITELIK